GKVLRIGPNLNLHEDRLHMCVLVLDGILNSDDVARLAAIDLMDQSGERRRLPRTRRPADQNESARQPRQGLNPRRKVEIGKPGYAGWQRTNCSSSAAPLMMEIDPEPSQTCHAIRAICDQAFPVGLQRVRRERRNHSSFNLRSAKQVCANILKFPFYSNARGSAGYEQQIAALQPDQLGEPTI